MATARARREAVAAETSRHVDDLEPPRTLTSPWATVLTRTADGLYLEAETGTARSLPAWSDDFTRHWQRGRPAWSRSPGGWLCVVDVDRVGVVWRSGEHWSAGHVAMHRVRRSGQALVDGVTFGVARREVEEWASGRAAARLAAVDVDGLLGPLA